jgi:hypothetical protein
LMYLDIERGYELSVKLLSALHDPFYAYEFEAEPKALLWLREFSQEVHDWLSASSPQKVFCKAGPRANGWELSIEIDELHKDPATRQICMNTAGRSDDARLHFECGSSETTADGWWGRRVKKKMRERQAGPIQKDGVLRLLVVDFSRLDTTEPNFFCWSGISTRIDETVRILAGEIGGEPPYDVVLPARLGVSSCFGAPVWLIDNQMDAHSEFIKHAGLVMFSEAMAPVA